VLTAGRGPASYKTMGVLPRSCERARNWISLDLDDELSELEGAMLRAHVERCAPCATYESEVTALTYRLRLAPLEPLLAPVVLPSRRRSVSRALQVGAAAAVAVVATGVGTLLASAPPPSRLTAPVPKTSETQLLAAYLDAPRGLPQHPPLSFRSRVGLDLGREDV
jgi:ferric-dicitrate binding protein FerR (iron transport regulator)